MNIFSCASARIYPSVLLLTSALAMSCAEGAMPPALQNPLLRTCVLIFIWTSWGRFHGECWLQRTWKMMGYSRTHASTVLFCFLFSGRAGLKVDGGTGLQCLVTIDEGLNTCQRTFISQLPRIHNGAQYADAKPRIWLSSRRARCHDARRRGSRRVS